MVGYGWSQPRKPDCVTVIDKKTVTQKSYPLIQIVYGYGPAMCAVARIVPYRYGPYEGIAAIIQ
jgi:hypothetical protein